MIRVKYCKIIFNESTVKMRYIVCQMRTPPTSDKVMNTLNAQLAKFHMSSPMCAVKDRLKPHKLLPQ